MALGVIAGWYFNVPSLKSVFPGFVSMKLNSALCLLCAAVALWMYRVRAFASWRDQTIRYLAIAICVIAGLTLLEYLTGFNLRIDQLLVTDADSAGPQAPGRIPVATALRLPGCSPTAMLLVNVPGRFGLAQILVAVRRRASRRSAACGPCSA